MDICVQKLGERFNRPERPLGRAAALLRVKPNKFSHYCVQRSYRCRSLVRGMNAKIFTLVENMNLKRYIICIHIEYLKKKGQKQHDASANEAGVGLPTKNVVPLRSPQTIATVSSAASSYIVLS